jgi:DeoR/GlpR family transcriptional regulator of sugar metabolism
MLTVERRRSMMQILQRDGKVLASELSQALQVSEDTIRRDRQTTRNTTKSCYRC